MASLNYSPELVISAGAVFPAVCSVLVGARFYTRIAYSQSIGVDDLLTLPAVLLLIGYGATMIVGARDGALGHPAPSNIPGPGSFHPTRIKTRQMLFATNLIQVSQLATVKLSFLFFYKRIFVTTMKNRFGIVCISMMGIVLAWWASFFFAYLFACGTRFRYYWNFSQVMQQTACIRLTALHNAYAISDVVIDVVIFVLPLPSIWRLNMTQSRKFAVTGVFALGALSIVASIMRMAVYIESNSVVLSGRVDVSMLTTGGIYWSMIESGLGLIAATLPIIYKLVKCKCLQSVVSRVRDIVSLRSLSRSSRGLPYAYRRSYSMNQSQGSGVNMFESRAESHQVPEDLEAGRNSREEDQILAAHASERYPVGGLARF